MIELREQINMALSGIPATVYFQTAPDTASFPYLVYDIPNIYDDGEGYQLVTLDVDGWDNKTDTAALETLMANVNKALNKLTVATESMAATFYLETKLTLTDDDARIRRRKYIYHGGLFERG